MARACSETTPSRYAARSAFMRTRRARAAAALRALNSAERRDIGFALVERDGLVCVRGLGGGDIRNTPSTSEPLASDVYIGSNGDGGRVGNSASSGQAPTELISAVKSNRGSELASM